MEVIEKRTDPLKFDEFINSTVKCLNVVCFNPMNLQKAVTKREKLWRILRIAYFWLVVINYVYSIFGMFAALFMSGVSPDMETVTSTVPNCLFLIIFVVRLTSIWLNRKDYQNLINTLKELYPVSHEDQKKYKVAKYLKKFCYLKRIYADYNL